MLKKFSSRQKTESEPAKSASDKHNEAFTDEELEKIKISSALNENKERLNEIMGKCNDLVIKDITLGRSETTPATIFYIDNMINSKIVDEDIIRPLVLDVYTSGLNTSSEIIKQLQAGNLVARGQTGKVSNFKTLFDMLLAGEVGIFIDKLDEAYIVSAKSFKYRAVTEPTVEPVVRGSREAFVEALSINLGLIRRRLHSPNLVLECMDMGKIGKNKVCMAYIKGICPSELTDEVRSRLKRIDIDGVLENGYIEEFIQDNPYSVFPQLRNTERPDVVVASMLEGRVAILTDNTPVALIAPGEFFSLMQSTEDYYNRYSFSSLIRLLRYLALVLATLLPALYIAITNYHQEMIPTGLLISIIAARAQVPFPAFTEALIMEVTFEILREAGVRLPRPLGQAVSIVGALVIGQAAVQANLVSPLMVIVVALTGIANFCIPQYNISLPVRIVRFPLMLMSATFGLFGVMIGVMFLLMHLFSLESFGKPYMAPLAPLRIGDLKDTAVRLPWWALVKRPAYSSSSSQRMKPGQVPKPPKKEDSR